MNQNPRPTIQDRLDAGELVPLDQLPQPDRDGLVPDIGNGRVNHDWLQEQRRLYGPNAVVTGAAYDKETHAVKPDPRWLGVYVTAQAFRSVGHNR